ncbi:AraC family transcriptional regulator [Xanthocytophaga flava]|uniref:AraC family transcriptional regulator n=1 Tax=Xanthocytophaga flava TaxID=3048013 RepID=UPI0028D0F3AB|nr:helix-turn-helix domain-containing protein [Xanthocytophaga flavus]MDJ1469274.1 helix-turn-helix domain-containing protein [Xanthocytophaga flavus]
MSQPADIRKLYTPVQPTIRPSTPDVQYYEFLPDPALQPFIYCYWQLKTLQPLSQSFTYRVVADGCIDVFFELNALQNAFVMGFCEKYTEFSLANTFNYIGIRFLPTMFAQLFGISASELSNRLEDLALVVPEMAQYIGKHFTSSLQLHEIKTLLDTYLFNSLSKVRFDNDNRVYKAIELILNHQGVLDVEKDLDTGLSSRQLRRLFEFYIGDTPKIFCKVVRFQHLLNTQPSAESLRHNKLFFELGYYDQAHFIKDFKHLYGTTPGKAFAE